MKHEVCLLVFGVMFRPLFLFFSLVVFTCHAFASSTSEVPFQECIANLQNKARSEGISARQTDEVLGNARFLKQVIGYDRSQPEFIQTFPGYFTKRVNDWRVNRGREMLAKHKDFLAELTRTYGVPSHYLISFWGLETNFGSYKGKMPIIDSLATLACDERRSAFFTTELMTALKLMDRESFDVDTMLGSWAGAMGHTQFMPSAYMQYAIDGDGDGRIDLWNSELDALASAANFLSELGWQPGLRWGREVSLPEGFDYSLAGKHHAKPLTFWHQAGVRKTNDTSLGNVDIDASLLIPAGHQGPAFLVYDNFDVILRWNNSEFYAISVGHLADRLVGAAALAAALPDLPTYSLEQMKLLQTKLNTLGIDVGEADGILGPMTRRGVRQFELANNMIADGFPDTQVFNAIMDVQTQ
ncbi:lytic murein transglycosylase [Aestuariibacter salexigens]|uniref:lytic murein transglycosylase n=1 Tax=Aestuariibacter salexigens TaxID=226010 RepID=UPI00040B2BD9|nr:lytic murein transglycosylase [Aestuariibacter salexigens]